MIALPTMFTFMHARAQRNQRQRQGHLRRLLKLRCRHTRAIPASSGHSRAKCQVLAYAARTVYVYTAWTVSSRGSTQTFTSKWNSRVIANQTSTVRLSPRLDNNQ